MIQRSTIAALVAITAVLIGVAASPMGQGDGDPGFAVIDTSADRPTSGNAGPPRERGVSLGEGGQVPDNVTVFDDWIPAVANLDPALLDALREAAADADDDGVELNVNSGWRSADYQEQLLRDAIDEYGSEEEAARWVATPETSVHVSGDAVDIGPSEAAEWLSDHGSDYGLCQIYANEPWHYELRADASDDGCPEMYADPTDDPRMQQ